MLQPAFLGLVLELERDEQRLQKAQQAECEERRTDAPEQQVHPEWRADLELENERTPEHQEPEDHDGEDSRTIARIDELVIEAALIAALAQCEQPTKERAFPTSRAARGEGGLQHRNGWR